MACSSPRRRGGGGLWRPNSARPWDGRRCQDLVADRAKKVRRPWPLGSSSVQNPAAETYIFYGAPRGLAWSPIVGSRDPVGTGGPSTSSEARPPLRSVRGGRGMDPGTTAWTLWSGTGHLGLSLYLDETLSPRPPRSTTRCPQCPSATVVWPSCEDDKARWVHALTPARRTLGRLGQSSARLEDEFTDEALRRFDPQALAAMPERAR